MTALLWFQRTRSSPKASGFDLSKRRSLVYLSQQARRRILSYHTISPHSDCVSQCDEQTARCMIAHINLDDRLSILRVGDPLRNWNSLDDQRVCVLCGRKFKGRQVDIRRLPGGTFKVCCPTLGCPSTPHQWRYAKPPVSSGRAETCWRHDRPNKTQRRVPESILPMQACRI